jgi:hypothetical protein
MARQVITLPFAGQLIGQGYNSQTSENVGTALDVDAVFEDSSTDAQSADYAFKFVADQDSLQESLGISASADARVGLFSGGAKMKFTNENSVNSFSTYIAGRSFIQNALRHGRGFRLTDAAARVLRTGGTDAFKRAFGDKFARTFATGGEFCVIARVTSISEEHQRRVAIALHGAYTGLAVTGGFQGAFETATTETHGHTEVEVVMHQFGGQGEQLAYTGPNATDIIARLRQLPEIVHQHAGGFEVEFASYDTIPIEVPSDEEREDRAIVLVDCAKQKRSFLQAMSDLGLALNPNGRKLFVNLPAANELIRIQAQYRDAMNALISHAIRVSTGVMNPPQLFVANPPPPALEFEKLPFASSSFRPEDFQGAWLNTTRQDVTTHMFIIPTDDRHANVRVKYANADFGEATLIAEWDTTEKVFKGGTSLVGPSSPFHDHDVRLVFDSNLTIGNPNGEAETLVVTHVFGPHQGAVHGAFRPPPNPTYIDVFRRIGT